MISLNKNTLKDNWQLLLVLVATLLVYAKFIGYGHISWDDPEMVFKNKDVINFNVYNFFKSHYVGNYLPITMLVHAFVYQLFGASDAAHHAVNILLHLINGIVLYKLTALLFNKKSVSILTVLVFLLHPLQIENVGWISELKTLLSNLFLLLALIQFHNHLASTKLKHLLLCFLFFILGTLCKPSAVILPVLLILFILFYYKTLKRKETIYTIPFFVVAIFFGIVNLKTQAADLFINHAHEFPYYQRIGMAGFALLNYLKLSFFPINQSVIYPYPEITNIKLIVGYLVLLLIIGLLLFSLIKKKINILFFILFFIVSLGLVLQLIPFGEVLNADRYMYLAIVPLIWFVATLIKNNYKIYYYVALLFLLTTASFIRGSFWKSALSIYEDIIQKYPDSFVALNSAGSECMFLNYDTKSLDYFNKATQVAPQNYKGFYNRGLLFLKMNKPELAVQSFNQTLALYDYNKALVGRANAYYLLQDFSKALNDANSVLQKDSKNDKAYFVIANCNNDINQLEEAIKNYNICISINPDNADYYFKRSIAFGKTQNFEKCLQDLNLCIEINPNYYEAYYWRGVVKVNIKQNPCEDFSVAAKNNYEPAINAINKYCK